MRMKRRNLIPAAIAAGALVAALAVPAISATTAPNGTVSACVSSSHTLTHVTTGTPLSCPSQQPVSWPVTVGTGSPSPSPSPTSASPTPTPTQTSPSPSPSPTSTFKGCTTTDGTCGAYGYGQIPMSNGFNTYVEAQQVGPNSGTADTLQVTNPGNWTDTANDVPYGYTGVQQFDNVQQLTNDWGNGGWGNCGSTCTDTPLASLSSLQVNYSETSPQDANSIYEFAPDVWNDNYGSDVMFWADTHGRCNEGAFGGTVLGNATIDGQNWTVHRYGGPGAEIIFVLDGAGGSGTCAQQSSGTIDILAGFQWLVSNGYMTSLGTLAQLNTGWEITSADNSTFSMNSYSITAQVAS